MSDAPLQPFWATFALLREQVERLVALNLFWTLPLVPGVIGLAYPALPLLLRTVLVGFSALFIVPASFAVYTVLARALSGREITFPETWQAFRQGVTQSFRSLAPLYVFLGVLIWANLSLPVPDTVLVPLRLLLLFTLGSSLTWGPLAAETPARSAAQLLRESFTLLLRHPARILWALAVSFLLLVAGTVSVGGLVLIVFVLLASYQTLLLHTLKG